MKGYFRLWLIIVACACFYKAGRHDEKKQCTLTNTDKGSVE